MNITKRAVREALGLKNDAALAAFFKTTRSAIHQWPEDAPIPQNRQWEFQARRPALFKRLLKQQAA